MKYILFNKVFLILGIGVLMTSVQSQSNSLAVSYNLADPVIVIMKENTTHLEDSEKDIIVEKYSKGIFQLFKISELAVTLEMKSSVSEFAMNYLNSSFTSYSDLKFAYKKMLTSLGQNFSDDCQGEWVGGAGFLSLCDSGEANPDIPSLCSYQCMDPYIAVECTLYFPCIAN